MRLRNKKTGEIAELNYYDGFLQVVDTKSSLCGNSIKGEYTSISELSAEWEDAPEEPKTFWAISWAGEPEEYDGKNTPQELKDMAKEIGNYFEAKEEAEKAIEKLKAWQRLKDKGLVIKKWRHTPDIHLTTGSFLKIEGYIPSIMDNIEDLDLLFSGEDN